jgi:hypothetical protein
MGDSVVISTLLLTVLLTIGQLFFIRASVKDRTQTVRLEAQESPDVLLDQLKQYFADRAYRVTSIEGDRNLVNLVGNVRPSLFLAFFLSGLAVVGTLCFVLVLNVVAPDQSTLWWTILAISPVAGVFYWNGAGRTESVSFLLETPTSTNDSISSDVTTSIIKVQAHRDEVESLRETLNLELLD